MNLLSDNGDVFTVRQLLVEGRSFDVALAVPAAKNTTERYVARAPSFADRSDETERRERHAALSLEVALCNQGCPTLPSDCRLCRADETHDQALIYREIRGKRLDAWLFDAEGGTTDTATILGIARDVALALTALHRANAVHRCLSPEHVIVRDGAPAESGSTGHRAVVIGLGNAAIKNAPACPAKITVDEAYSAPEIHNELSGRFNTPSADVYSFGLVLAFLVTGERPTGNVMSPMTRTAVQKLSDADRGLALLIAKCIQPLQKSRPSLRAVTGYIQDADALPKESMEGFGALALLAPWMLADPSELRVGNLTPGPLVNRSNPPASIASDAGDTDRGMSAPASGPAEASVPFASRWVISALVMAAAIYVVVKTLF